MVFKRIIQLGGRTYYFTGAIASQPMSIPCNGCGLFGGTVRVVDTLPAVELRVHGTVDGCGSSILHTTHEI